MLHITFLLYCSIIYCTQLVCPVMFSTRYMLFLYAHFQCTTATIQCSVLQQLTHWLSFDVQSWLNLQQYLTFTSRSTSGVLCIAMFNYAPCYNCMMRYHHFLHYNFFALSFTVLTTCYYYTLTSNVQLLLSSPHCRAASRKFLIFQCAVKIFITTAFTFTTMYALVIQGLATFTPALRKYISYFSII